MNTTDDLFGMLESDPRWDSPPVRRPRRKAEERCCGAVTECWIDGTEYRIERHTHKRDEDDLANDRERTFWKLFVREGKGWRRLRFLGPQGKGIDPDCADIPPELLYRAEQSLEWAAGGMDRSRALTASLRPPVKDEDDEFDP